MFIDSHSHLDFFAEKELTSALECAYKKGVLAYVIPSVGKENWQAVAKLAQRKGCYPAYGIHPLYVQNHSDDDIHALENFLVTHPAVAIGECGLDYAGDGDYKQQQYFFEAQIALAQTYRLPLIIHARLALETILQTLKRSQITKFVVHSFTGSNQQLQMLLDLGGYVGFGGTITYQRAKRLREQIVRIPADRYLLETDAPYQSVPGSQSKQNELVKLVDIADTIAELRGVSRAQIGSEATQNTKTLFKI